MEVREALETRVGTVAGSRAAVLLVGLVAQVALAVGVLAAFVGPLMLQTARSRLTLELLARVELVVVADRAVRGERKVLLEQVAAPEAVFGLPAAYSLIPS